MTIKKQVYLIIESYLMPPICNFYNFPRVSCDCVFFCKFPHPALVSLPKTKISIKKQSLFHYNKTK